MREALLLPLSIALAATAVRLATFSHASPVDVWPTLAAAGAVALSCVPGPYFRAVFSNGAARQLAAVAWRLLTMLVAFGLAGWWEGAARNCYLTTLLACYFVALPLESWLLIRQCRL